ncbi:MAG TPA: carboxypeptidase-like regulatory domain-containing protein [Thermoanaerobaculia bacterium]|nr:carboxypeptidase-like regulatory domain-containing protein [Thermoanaerobaculia bacterium]
MRGSLLVAYLLWLGPAALAAADRGTIEIHFGGPQEGAHYVALVPEEVPWAEPLRESVEPASALGVRWEVPPGRYRVVCAAHGRQVARLPTVTLEGSGRENLACVTRPLVAVTGELRSTIGNAPIAGARVGHVHAFLADDPSQLSVMGEDFTRADRSTLTDEAGRFRLLGPARVSAMVWVEAKGFSPAELPDTHFGPDGGDLGTVRLAAGAALAARLDAVPAGWGRYRIGLRRHDATGAGDGERLARRIWRRPLDPASLAWQSLAPGSYDVVLGALDAPVAAATLATVNLRAGERRELVLSLPPAPAAMPPVKTGTVADLRLLVQENDAQGGPAELEPRRFDGAGIAPVAASAAAVAGGTLWQVPDGCRAGWLYWLGGPQQVAAPVEVPRDGCTRALRLKLFAASEVHGRMIAPTGAALPAVGRVGAAFCAKRAGDAGDAIGSFPTAVGKDGRWSAAIPAGCVDLSIEAGDFAAVAYRGLQAAASGSSDLGAQSLTFGAGLTTRIASDDGGPVEGAVVELFPAGQVAQVVAASYSQRQPAAVGTARSEAGGWVRLRGLPAGEFVVRVRAPQAPPFVSEPVTLLPRQETVVPDLHLPAPAVLRVRLRPSERLAAVYASYLVRVKGVGPSSAVAGASVLAPARADGAAEIARLAPGRWQVAVMARGGGGLATLHEEETEIRAGVNSLTLDLDTKVYQGRVTYRQQPLAATLDLRPVRRDDRSATRVSSSADGTFSVVLDRTGRYAVDVQTPQGSFLGTVPSVAFDDGDDPVEIRVPDGTVAGMVVDRQEKPVAKARVVAEQVAEAREAGAQTGDLEATARGGVSDGDGRFQVDRLAPGPWSLVATLDDRSSDPVRVAVQDEIPQEGIKLVIPDRAKLTGHVLSPSGEPVPGAAVTIDFPPDETAPLPRRAVAMSAADGSFDVEQLATAGSVVNVAVRAAGFPVSTSRRPLAAGALEIQLAAVGGSVALHLATGSWSEFPPDLVVFVAADGSVVGSATAGAASRFPWQWLSLPSLAAGPWTLARLDSIASEIAAVAGAARSLVPLAQFTVVAGGSVQVEVATLRP